MLDPAIHAIRSDIADIRLAGRVFAPHYAEPMICRLSRPSCLRSSVGETGERLADLVPGERFEMLDLAKGIGWGVAPAHGLVGYVDAEALVTGDGTE